MLGQRKSDSANTHLTPVQNIEKIKVDATVPARRESTGESSGDKTRTLTLTRENLIGTWATKSSGCATDDTLSFQRQGSYVTYGTEGRWLLNANTINISISREMTGETDQDLEDVWQVNKPVKKYSYPVARVGNNEILINRESYIRC